MAKQNSQPGQYHALKQAIREKRPERLYFFHGEETFLLQHYLEQLRKLLIDDLTESFNYHKLTAESFNAEAFAGAVENLPMMAEYTMVWVDDVDIAGLPEGERTRLCEVFADIPDYCCVVFTFVTEQWPPDKRMKKLWDAINTYGTVVEFPKQELRDLIPWITRHFGANGKQISPDLCSYLAEITGGSMTAIAGEVKKICAYSGSDQIKKSDIDAVTEPVLDAVVGQMSNLLVSGNYGMALQKLQQLLKMQQDPIYLLGALGSHFRKLANARILLDAGKNAGEYIRIYHVSDYVARRQMEDARRFSAKFCAKAAELVMETDWMMKTSADDPKRLLEILILQLAQEARNG